MSIPSVFDPIEIDNRLLVDGGLINNLPAQRVKEMGADIIIGVNVGFHYYSKDELNSMFRIIEQSLFFYGEDLNRKNKATCDLLISPEMSKYNVTSFNSVDSIIAIGERAARKVMPRLKALADSLKRLDPEYGHKKEIPIVDSIQLMEIHFKGLEKVSQKLVSGKLQLTALQKVTPEDLEKAIERVYSSLYFENVTYEIQQGQSGACLIVNLKESKGGLIRVGLHYDSNHKSGILLNTTFRNLLLNGSKLSINTSLGENPFFRATLIKNNGWKPGLGFNFESNRNLMYFYQDSKKISTISYSATKVQLYTQSILWNSFALGAGIEHENSLIKPIIDPVLGISKNRQDFTNYFGFLHMDSYNNAFYPSQGAKLHSEMKLITASEIYSPIVFLSGQFSFANKISRRLSLIGHISGGAVTGDSIPPQYMFYTGGLTDEFRNGILPFVGLDYMEKSNRNALLVGIDVQIKFWEKIYVILKGNAGNTKDKSSELLTYDKVISGYGISLGYDSFIGPIEVTASRSGNRKGLLGFVSIGFYF
jgi:NTE family protein